MHIKFIYSSSEEDKINCVPIFVCPTLDQQFGFIFVASSSLDRKIQYHENRTFLFRLSIEDIFRYGKVFTDIGGI